MTTVGIRELKNRLSEFLRKVADGERVTVTDRGRPVAIMSPPDAPAEHETVARMVAFPVPETNDRVELANVAVPMPSR